jgi:hypothetical protein
MRARHSIATHHIDQSLGRTGAPDATIVASAVASHASPKPAFPGFPRGLLAG